MYIYIYAIAYIYIYTYTYICEEYDPKHNPSICTYMNMNEHTYIHTYIHTYSRKVDLADPRPLRMQVYW